MRAALAVALLTLVGVLALSSSALADGELSYKLESSFKAEGVCSIAEPGAAAVNETSGDVYVLDRATSSAARFGPSGECLGRIEPPKAGKAGPTVGGIAVDNSSSASAGDVYITTSTGKAVNKFTATGTFLAAITKGETIETIETFLEQIHGVAVDDKGTLWVYQGKAEETTLDSYSSGEPNEFVTSLEVIVECPPRRGLAVGPGAKSFYVGRARETRKEGQCESATTVAVKLTENGETATELLGPGEGLPGEPAFFAQLDNQATTGFGVNQETGEVFFDHGTSVSAYAPTGIFVQRFGNQGGPNSLQSGAGVAVDAKTSDVWVYDSREGGFLDQFVPKTFEETPAEAGVGLPDGRAYEQVSPLNKLGSSLYPISNVFGQVQASEDGDAITYSSNAPIVPAPPTNRAIEPTQNLSRRGSSSWSTEDIMPPGGKQAAGYAPQSGDAYEAFSSDLTVGFLNPANHQTVTPTEPLLSPEATETAPFRRDLTSSSGECEPLPSSCYSALVSPLNADSEVPFGPIGTTVQLKFTSATPDGRYAALLSTAPLTGEAVAQNLEEGLYEWEAGGGPLKLVSVFPAGESPPEQLFLRLGGQGQNAGSIMRNAISRDGSKVVWSTGEGAERLYVRDTAKDETIRIDVKAGSKAPKSGRAQFQSASADGSKVFFTDIVPLTEDATTEKGEAGEEEAERRGLGDLYVCEVHEEAGKLACTLKDLTAEVKGAGEEAALQGVSGASEDGSYVYFVANGSLGPHGGSGNCVPREGAAVKEEREGILPVGRCSMYVEHFNAESEAWEAPQLVASLSSLDQNDWHLEPSAGGLIRVTSRVAPHGEYFAFQSVRSLTGYNNEDVNPAAKGARDVEVFLYHAGPEPVVQCVSCKAGGGRPQGVFDQIGSGEGLGLFVDRSENLSGLWLAGNIPGWTGRANEAAVYQSRYLSDSGRLFFTSADALVPAAEGAVRKETVNGEETTVGVENVYESEPNGQGSCEHATGCISLISTGSSPQESTFLDASVNGDSVFILTSQELSSADKDTGFDIYDARVCSTGSPCLTPPAEPPPPCSGEACRGSSTSVPAPPAVPPTNQPGPGNIGSTTVVRGGEPKPPPPPKPPTRAQKLKKALKACGKIKKKKKRTACVKQAKKRYGTTAKKKKK